MKKMHLSSSPKVLGKMFFLFALLLCWCFPAHAESGFRVNEIEVQGLQRMSPSTVRHYLPIKRGEALTEEQTAKLIRSLYKTGFFERITLARRGDVLIVRVVERPIIGYLKISGNSALPTDKLETVMKNVDIVEGRIYNPAILERIKQSLLNQYYQLGYYNARIEVLTESMPGKRISIKINISEGVIAKIRGVHIIGNHIFSEPQLDKQLTLSMPNLFSFLTQSDRYSEEKLEESLEKLRNFYLDHGYLKFAIKSAQAEITPDRKSIYVVITVDEGQLYRIKGYELKGETAAARENLAKKIAIEPGSVFSRQAILDTEKVLTESLGNEGYLLANVSVEPKIDEANKEVTLVFLVKPGKRVYVHHLYFGDNHRTNDEALRREVLQMEGAPGSSSRLEESKHRLTLLPYIKEVQMSVKPVPETDDQVDVLYKLTEESSAQASVTASYSLVDRLGFGVGLNQKNFFGTGNTLGINFNQNRYEKYYNIAYSDPYYTMDGVSRDINLYVSRVNPSGANLTKAYTSNDYGAAVTYGIPIGQEKGVFSRLYLGLGYSNTLVHLTSQPTNQVLAFVNEHGRHFQQAYVHTGLTRDSRDKAIFPTAGAFQKLFGDLYAPLDSGSLKYYQINYEGKWYYPFGHGFIGTARAIAGYGNSFEGISGYPFFKNFYAGGFDTVHGYEGNTLGPRDSNDNPFGGNLSTIGEIGIIVPNYVESLRTIAFLDAGNVFIGNNNRKFGGQSTGSGPLRYSAGVEADWLAPMGFAVGFSYAKPLNRQPGDKDQRFQFSLGANLG